MAIRDALVHEARESTPRFDELVAWAIADLSRSVNLAGMQIPSRDAIVAETAAALTNGHIMITRVNSDNEIEELLDENGQLKLRTPMNIFIGGQILDRGLTINNLIGFYYGRDPSRFQQDTVLQHSRMYGVRPRFDLAVTRFYAPLHVYHVMRRIHAIDAALREAFDSGAHDRGVYFIQKDAENRLITCSPNKLLLSNLSTIRPGRRLLPVGFQTVARSRGAKALEALDREVRRLTEGTQSEPVSISAEDGVRLLNLAYDNLQFENERDDERRAHVAALEHLSLTATNDGARGRIWLITARDRRVKRYREEGRYSNAPDTKQQAEAAERYATDVPVLTMLRQDGDVELGWRGLPFWWPVILTPTSAVTSIFSTDVGEPETAEA
jgi:hypothetical protein